MYISFKSGQAFETLEKMRKHELPKFKTRYFTSNHCITLSKRAVIYERRTDSVLLVMSRALSSAEVISASGKDELLSQLVTDTG